LSLAGVRDDSQNVSASWRATVWPASLVITPGEDHARRSAVLAGCGAARTRAVACPRRHHAGSQHRQHVSGQPRRQRRWLSSTGNYAINFQVIKTRDGAAFTGNNAQILTRSNSYFDFSPLSGSVPHDVALPTIDSSGVYNFHVGGVGPDHITFVDPMVAIGYHYLIGTGDPNFQSVLLPNVGDGAYTLSFVDGAGNHSVNLLHDQQYFFGVGGVGDFTITGIETSAGLDPSNPNAFITGLTFSGVGDFTGTMTPLTATVAAVPEPETYALMLVGLVLMASLDRRRRRKR
jgi:hypothetical protein